MLLVVLSVLTLYPLATLLYGSLHTTPPGVPGEFNLNGYKAVLSAANVRILLDTLGIAFLKTAIAVALAMLFAWIVARTDTPYRRTLEVLIALPFFIPPVITATAWTVMGNPQVGTINLIWRWVTGTNGTIINVYSYFGVIWHMVQYSTPFIFLFIVDAFRAFDPSLEESSRMSGASRWQTLRRITLVLLLPIITSAFILSFIRGIEAFESPLIFGRPANIYVLTTEIYRAINVTGVLPEYQYATALAFSVLLLMFLLIFFQWWLLGNRSYQTVTGKGYSPGIMKLGRWRWVTFSICVLFFLVAVALPFAQLLVGSFFRLFGFYNWEMLTLEHYEWVLENRQVWRAFYNTMFLGVAGATATMILGGMVAYVSVRTRWRGRRLIEIARVAALDDARNGARRRLPVGLCHHPRTDRDLRHGVGAAAGLYHARHAARGAHHERHLHPAFVRYRGVLARARRKLAADAVAHPDRAVMAGLCGRLDPDVLRHHARVERFGSALFRRLRGALGGDGADADRRSAGAGHRDRTDDDASRFPVPLGAARDGQAAPQHGLRAGLRGQCRAGHND